MNVNLNDALYEQTREQNVTHSLVVGNGKFVFIQIPKTGSTTIIQELKRNGLTNEIKCYRHEGLKFLQHLYVNKNLPIYTIVRNPYRKTVSYFFHKIKMEEIIVNKENIIEEFRSWCKNIFTNNDNNHQNKLHIVQYKYLEIENRMIQSKIKVFKFENNGIKNFLEYLNKTYQLKLNIDYHTNDNDNDQYKNIEFKSFFNNELIELIQKVLNDDFVLFNYSKDINQA